MPTGGPALTVRPACPAKAACGGRILRGFSYLELVLVVLIIALLARVAVPRMANSLILQSVESVARRIGSDLSLAQRRARQTSAAQRVSFNTATNSYRLVGLPDADRPTAEYVVRLSELAPGVQMLSPNFGGDADLIFDGHGMPDSAGSVYVAGGGHIRRIAVEASTGRASVTEVDTLPASPAPAPPS